MKEHILYIGIVSGTAWCIVKQISACVYRLPGKRYKPLKISNESTGYSCNTFTDKVQLSIAQYLISKL